MRGGAVGIRVMSGNNSIDIQTKQLKVCYYLYRYFLTLLMLESEAEEVGSQLGQSFVLTSVPYFDVDRRLTSDPALIPLDFGLEP